VGSPALAPHDLSTLDAHWRAANYLSVGQIYLRANPLLREPLKHEHIKARLLGHWGTTPGLNFIYSHCNRVIGLHDLSMIFICGPGHGGPGVVANTWLDGTYTELYSDVTQDAAGMARLFKQFSFPGGVPSHTAPEVPGSIHEGGELGYSLLHAYGAAFDNPDLVVCCVIGDGEAETGALAASWHSNKFLHPARDGVVIPIIHLNGYKIGGPTVLSRISRIELRALLSGYGYQAHFVEGSQPRRMHRQMASAFDKVVRELQEIRARAERGDDARPRWPMIVLPSPKGWTCPREVDGEQVEGSARAHQIPVGDAASDPKHLRIVERWMKSYRPRELFDNSGAPVEMIRHFVPRGERRMSANPHANGGLLLRELSLPDFRNYAVAAPKPAITMAAPTPVLGEMLRDVIRMNAPVRNFRMFGPDETSSNRLNAVFEATDLLMIAPVHPSDDNVSPEGRVMEVLSEHMCQGWLEGYLLTGRHGFFPCYEAFIHVVDSMFNQHAKWLKSCAAIPWRKPIASLNYLLTSHVWRQDHNGFSHQDPGFLDLVANKGGSIVRIYLPPDANCLLSVEDHCLRSRNYINVVIAGKHEAPVFLDIEAAVRHCSKGAGIWSWAGSDRDSDPEVVMACAGDVPTVETLAAVDLLRNNVPDLKIRVVNVVDLMTLQSPSEHPHGLADAEFDGIFTRDRPVIFAFHGYPSLVHRLAYRRTNHANIHVHGYREEGTTTTPFDMTVLNRLDRFHLALNAVQRVPRLREAVGGFKRMVDDKLEIHRQYITEHGEDLPEIRNWRWTERQAQGNGSRVETAGSRVLSKG